jgi:hypothetical protein
MSLFNNNTPEPAGAFKEYVYGLPGNFQLVLIGYVIIFNLSEFSILGEILGSPFNLDEPSVKKLWMRIKQGGQQKIFMFMVVRFIEID